MKNQTYDIEERLLEYSAIIIKKDILEEIGVECSVLNVCFSFEVESSMLNPPEADKCLLASGELGVHLLTPSTLNRELKKQRRAL